MESIVISGYRIPNLTKEIVVDRTNDNNSVVGESELRLGELPMPMIDGTDGEKVTLDGSYRLSINPAVIPTGCARTSVKVVFHPNDADYGEMQSLLTILPRWRKRWPVISGEVLDVPSEIGTVSISTTMTSADSSGYREEEGVQRGSAVMEQNPDIQDILDDASAKMEQEGEHVAGSWTVREVRYSGSGTVGTAVLEWTPVDGRSFAKVTSEVPCTVEDRRRKSPHSKSTLRNECVAFFSFSGDAPYRESVRGIDWSHGEDFVTLNGKVGAGTTVISQKSTSGLFHYISNDDYHVKGIQELTTASGDGVTLSGWFFYESSIFVNGHTLPMVCMEAKNTYTANRTVGSLYLAKRNDIIYLCPRRYLDNGNERWSGGIMELSGLSEGWHNFVMTYRRESGSSNVSICRAYIDGVKIGNDVSMDYGTDGELKYITIARHFGNDYKYNGGAFVDEIGIWNRLLTEEEIISLYEAGNSGITYPFDGV